MLNSNFCLTARNYELQQEFGELAKKPSFDRRDPNPKPKRNGPKSDRCSLHSLGAAMASDVPSCSLRKYSKYRTIH